MTAYPRTLLYIQTSRSKSLNEGGGSHPRNPAHMSQTLRRYTSAQ